LRAREKVTYLDIQKKRRGGCRGKGNLVLMVHDWRKEKKKKRHIRQGSAIAIEKGRGKRKAVEKKKHLWHPGIIKGKKGPGGCFLGTKKEKEKKDKREKESSVVGEGGRGRGEGQPPNGQPTSLGHRNREKKEGSTRPFCQGAKKKRGGGKRACFGAPSLKKGKKSRSEKKKGGDQLIPNIQDWSGGKKGEKTGRPAAATSQQEGKKKKRKRGHAADQERRKKKAIGVIQPRLQMKRKKGSNMYLHPPGRGEGLQPPASLIGGGGGGKLGEIPSSVVKSY